MLGDERHDGDHGETAIVEFTGSLSLDGLGANVGKVNLGKDNFRQLASHHVVRLFDFRGDFGNQNGGKDLCLACGIDVKE